MMYILPTKTVISDPYLDLGDWLSLRYREGSEDKREGGFGPRFIVIELLQLALWLISVDLCAVCCCQTASCRSSGIQ